MIVHVKKALLTSLFLLTSICLFGQDNKMDKLILAIATVESELNEKVVSGDCVGYLQIRPILVKDCNKILKEQKSTKRYTMNDRYSKEKSIEMFYIYQQKYNPSFDIEKALWIWNAGPFSKVRPTGYINKVMKVYNNI